MFSRFFFAIASAIAISLGTAAIVDAATPRVVKLRTALSIEGILFHRLDFSGTPEITEPEQTLYCKKLGIECVTLPSSKAVVQILPGAREFVERLRVHSELEVVWVSEADYTDFMYLFNQVLVPKSTSFSLHSNTLVSVNESTRRLKLLTSRFYFLNAREFKCTPHDFEACWTTSSRDYENFTWIGPDDLFVPESNLATLESLRPVSHMVAITPNHRDLGVFTNEWVLKGQARQDRAQRLNVLMGLLTQGVLAVSGKFPKANDAAWILANNIGTVELSLSMKPLMDLKALEQVCADVAPNGDVVRVYPLSECKFRVMSAWVLDPERKTARCLEFDPFSGSVFSASKENPLQLADCADDAPLLAYLSSIKTWVDVANYFTHEETAERELKRLRKNLAQQTVDWIGFANRFQRISRLESYSFHWWFAVGKVKHPDEFDYVQEYFRDNVSSDCEKGLEVALENPGLISTPEFRKLFMTMQELMLQLASGVQDLIFYHYSSSNGLFNTLGLTTHEDRGAFHARAQEEETYAQVIRYMRTHRSASGAWFMAEDPNSSRGYGNWQVRLTLKPTARFAKWDQAVINAGVTRTLERLGLSGVCSKGSYKGSYRGWHNRNPLVHLLLEDEQVDFIEDHVDERRWFQFLRPQSALQGVDGDHP